MIELLGQFIGPILGLVATGLVGIVAWLLNKTHLAAEFKEALAAFTRRVVDKAQDRLKIAMAPDSEGGVVVTANELSAIRQAVWDLLKQELDGPLAKMLVAWGEQRVKGYVGMLLLKWGITAAAPAAV